MERSTSHSYTINYHIVWCLKHPKRILLGEVADFVKECIQTIAATKNWGILELAIMPDHIHLVITCSPLDSPISIVKILKGVIALRLLKQFPVFRQKLRGELWSAGYYVGTAGQVSTQTIQHYVQEQRR